MKHRKLALLTIMLLMVVMLGSVAASCETSFDNEKSPLVIATGELDGVFSPFFSTSGYDSQVVGMTQIGMLTIDEDARTDYGDDVSTVVRYARENAVDTRGPNEMGENQRFEDKYFTEYEFVIKNGIKFADGVELTYEDVLFNLYMYLDPVYNGSNTLYSTDILGLAAYRTQNKNAVSASDYERSIQVAAMERRDIFINYFVENPRPIDDPQVEANILSDLAYLKKTFREEELNSDWSTFAGGLEEYSKEYVSVNGTQLVTEVWQIYLINWGAAEVKYDVDGDDPTKYLSVDYGNHTNNIARIKSDNKKASSARIQELIRDYCIDVVYSNFFGSIEGSNDVFIAKKIDFLTMTSTGIGYIDYLSNQIKTANLSGSDKDVPNIRGITAYKLEAGSEFKDNLQGATLSGEDSGDAPNESIITLDEDHWVVKIVIYGVDPKALLSFAITVTPMHYYSNPKSGSTYTAEDGYAGFSYEDNHFGFPFADINYMNEVVKGVSGLPMGAGVYQPSNSRNEEDLSKVTARNANTGFYDSNIVYYVRNKYFETTAKSDDVFNARIKYLRLSVTNITRLFDAVKTETVHFADPSAKKEIVGEIENPSTRGALRSIKTRTNGYGYIGINAKYIPDLEIRQAIMYAMDTNLVTQYYPTGLVENIYRPISKESWAYPEDAVLPYYGTGNVFNADDAKVEIKRLMEEAQYTVWDSKGYFTKAGNATRKLEYTFTVAGGNSDHPAYLTMMTAAEILNDCGFKVKVITDPFALRKLSSGRLTVWAAAWNSSLDPDMYQVYHKDSKATSILAWGYPSMMDGDNDDPRETGIIEDLSEQIEKARKITDIPTRKSIYSDCLDLIMELAVELPTYQRSDLYVYKNTIIDETSIRLEDECTSYIGPLNELWKVSFVNG